MIVKRNEDFYIFPAPSDYKKSNRFTNDANDKSSTSSIYIDKEFQDEVLKLDNVSIVLEVENLNSIKKTLEKIMEKYGNIFNDANIDVEFNTDIDYLQDTILIDQRTKGRKFITFEKNNPLIFGLLMPEIMYLHLYKKDNKFILEFVIYDEWDYILSHKNVCENFEKYLKDKTKVDKQIDLYIGHLNKFSRKSNVNKFARKFCDLNLPIQYIATKEKYNEVKSKILNNDKYDDYNSKTYKGLPNTLLNHFGDFIESDYNTANIIEKINNETDESEFDAASNIIYYGVPGSGKSYSIDRDFVEYDNNTCDGFHRTRTVFHPDYTYSDFVGQIVPIIDNTKSDKKELKYDYKGGPFANALYDAFRLNEDKHVLIIEEINRGNASAIFGDIFQLLDRDENGESSYIIHNDDLTSFLANRFINDETIPANEKESYEQYLNIYKDIYIPENLWLVGTMNTCDQNVYPLDTAFKRRWELKRIKNEFENTKEEDDFKVTSVCGSDITWEKFNKVINTEIVNNGSFINSDDKRLGVHFVSKRELENKEKFAEKALMYLWNDVAKLNLKKYFKINDKIRNFDDMIDVFLKKGETNINDAFRAIFSDKIVFDLFGNNEKIDDSKVEQEDDKNI